MIEELAAWTRLTQRRDVGPSENDIFHLRLEVTLTRACRIRVTLLALPFCLIRVCTIAHQRFALSARTRCETCSTCDLAVGSTHPRERTGTVAEVFWLGCAEEHLIERIHRRIHFRCRARPKMAVSPSVVITCVKLTPIHEMRVGARVWL